MSSPPLRSLRMFCKLSLLAFVAPLVSALTLNIPKNPTSSGTITITWTLAANDPETWSFELINPAFNDAFAIANDVNPTAQSLTLTLPVVPVGDGYSLQAVDVGNINNVFASTGDFAIGASTASVSSAATTVSTANLSSIRASSAVTSTHASSSSVAASASASVGTSAAATASATTPASTSAASAAGSASASATGTTAFSGALSSRLGNTQAGVAAALLSVVAGAAMIAL